MIWMLLRRLWPGLIGALGVFALLAVGKRNGALEQRVKRHERDAKARSDGRAAVRDGRASGLTADERVRRNDDAWRGL